MLWKVYMLLDDSDYMTIMGTVSVPVLVASPVYDSNRKITDFHVEYENPAFKEMAGLLIKENMFYHEFKSALPASIDWFNYAVRAMQEKTSSQVTYYASPIKKWFSVLMDCTGNGFCVITFSDISWEKEQQKKIDYMSHYDSLTGLPNRNLFNIVLASAIVRTEERGLYLGLMLIDIDNMKTVNDVSGHSAGDAVLVKSSALLRSVRKGMLRSFRLGDDEFVIVMMNLASKQEIDDIGNDIFNKFQEAHIEISGGITVCPDDGLQAKNLLKYADLAMHSAKKNGKNHIEYFEDSMYRDFLNHTILQNKVLSAAQNKSFMLYFQPQYTIENNKLRGFEALLRWHDEASGWVEPDVFIPVLEEVNAMVPVGSWVIETAVKTLKKWQVKYNFDGIMSVNVSPSQLKKLDFVYNLYEVLNQYTIKPEKFEIEITESILIDDMDKVLSILRQIRYGGVNIALDDFGTGYSSYRYLQLLPLTTLKIDKSFIANLHSNDCVETEITDSIVALVSHLGLETIAEGVETDTQLDILKKTNCSIVQGFLRGRPMETSQCESVLAEMNGSAGD
jgi:diguanylate cyclase (GGDEF)-like protein